MLTSPEIIAFLPTINSEKSKRFYCNLLALKLESEDDYALVFRGENISLRITVVPELIPHPFTVLGFSIDNIESQIITLKAKGVNFENYNSLEQDAFGIWTSPSKARIAWFKDPDGNLISLTQLPK